MVGGAGDSGRAARQTDFANATRAILIQRGIWIIQENAVPIRDVVKFSLGGSSLIFAGAFDVSLLGRMTASPFCLLRFCGFRFAGFISFLFEDWLEQIPFGRTSILVIRVLLLHNFLRRPLSLQHPECG